MRIKKIEIENINSLKGYWCIDFTHPDYKKNHDLFVICGETGAGKTTLLDAITLALYGRTPRQNSLVSSNEVMTKHTAKCMARVTYECKKGTFISEFSQSRSRGKLDGNLTKPCCQITNSDTNQVYPNLAVSALAQKTSEIIKLEYDQFCRSIMLAQGEFSKFIDGSERERSDILAKLSGTEKYKMMGQAVHYEFANAKRIFEDFSRQRDGIKVLSEKEIEDLNIEKENLDIDSKKYASKLDEFSSILNWLNQMESLSDKVDNALKQRNQYECEEKDFTDKKIILEKAENAKNCAVPFLTLNEIRKNLTSEKERLSDLDAEINEAHKKFTNANSDYEKAKKSFDSEDGKSADLDKLWETVSKKDFLIENKNDKLYELEKNKNESSEIFNKKKTEFENFTKNIDAYEKNISELKSYLKNNEKDAELSSLIGNLEGEKNHLQDCISEISTKQGEKSTLEKNNASEKEKCTELKAKTENLNSELQKLVSTEFISISKLIRDQLKKDMPCPVCGSKEHPSCTENFSDKKDNSSALKVGSDVAALHKKLEESEEKINELQKIINNNEIKIIEVEKQIKENQEKQENISNEINSKISAWNFKINELDVISSLNEILEKFKSLSSLYKNKYDRLAENNQKLKENQINLSQINLSELEKKYNKDLQNYNLLETELKGLEEERKNLFGNKVVSEEKENYKNLIEKLKAETEKTQQDKIEAEKTVNILSSQIEDCKKNILLKQKSFETAQRDFNSVLDKNGFISEEEFVRCNVNDDEFNSLKNQNETLKEKNVRTNAALTEAKRNFEDCKKLAKTDKSKSEIEIEKSFILKEKSETDGRIGSIGTIFEDNKKHVEESKEIIEGYNQASEQYVLWTELKSLIGKSDGSDFEVFVQAMAFKRLINKANKYVFSISGKYELIQIDGHVDFLVHDINYPDQKEDRPISNMSGGEKFIISLSLALGIAELASENVQVDSLFLDEGFGTLSGNPLTEAINALKQLQTSGKMLGIITHVDTVINEFDQKIKAIKKNGGISELEGSGITHK